MTNALEELCGATMRLRQLESDLKARRSELYPMRQAYREILLQEMKDREISRVLTGTYTDSGEELVVCRKSCSSTRTISPEMVSASLQRMMDVHREQLENTAISMSDGESESSETTVSPMSAFFSFLRRLHTQRSDYVEIVPRPAVPAAGRLTETDMSETFRSAAMELWRVTQQIREIDGNNSGSSEAIKPLKRHISQLEQSVQNMGEPTVAVRMTGGDFTIKPRHKYTTYPTITATHMSRSPTIVDALNRVMSSIGTSDAPPRMDEHVRILVDAIKEVRQSMSKTTYKCKVIRNRQR
jgi:hypothetical protein